jgi:hypothetical protein
MFYRALRETETETANKTDWFSINGKPTDGRFSKRLGFGFPNYGRFSLLGCNFSDFLCMVFLESFFCSYERVIHYIHFVKLYMAQQNINFD